MASGTASCSRRVWLAAAAVALLVLTLSPTGALAGTTAAAAGAAGESDDPHTEAISKALHPDSRESLRTESQRKAHAAHALVREAAAAHEAAMAGDAEDSVPSEELERHEAARRGAEARLRVEQEAYSKMMNCLSLAKKAKAVEKVRGGGRAAQVSSGFLSWPLSTFCACPCSCCFFGC